MFRPCSRRGRTRLARHPTNRMDTHGIGARRLAVESLETRRLLALTAMDDTFSGIVEDSRESVLDVLRNDIADPGATLTILSASMPDEGGSLAVDDNGRTLLYDPPPDFSGTTQFSYQVRDSDGDQSQAHVTVHVLPVNDAPRMTQTFSLAKSFEFHGNSPNDGLGHSVGRAGDVNGDGVEDIILGAPWDDTNGQDSGAVTVLSGKDRSVLYTFHGNDQMDEFGWSVSGAGDTDGDGRPDMLIGARKDDHASYEAGSAYVFSGADGLLLQAVHGRGLTQFGSSVSGAGDVNADGYDDILVGSPTAVDDDFLASTEAQVFSGVDGKVLHTFGGGVWEPGFARSVAGVGDVTGDGVDDVVLVPSPSTSDFARRGVSVYSGADGSLYAVLRGETSTFGRTGSAVASAGDVDGDGAQDVIWGIPESNTVHVISASDGRLLFSLHGDSMDGEFGTAVGSAGDVNGDGVLDLAVGDPGDDHGGVDAGSVRVFSGHDGSVLDTLTGDSAGDRFGQTLTSVGDINADGLSDMVVGAPFDDKTGIDSGSANLYESTVAETRYRLAPIDADHPSTEGVIADLFPELLTDADHDAVGGIAILSATGNGTWQFSLDRGNTYIDFGAIDGSRSLLLRETDSIRYTPDSAVPETARLTLVGWDQTGGTAGRTMATHIRGGASAFSADTAIADLDVYVTHHAPTASRRFQTHSYTEGQEVVPLDDIVVVDVDHPERIHVTLILSDISTGVLTADSGNGQAYDHQTGIWSASGSVAQVNAALADVAFRPAADNDHNSTIFVVVAGGELSQGDALRGRIDLKAVAVNDAPVLDARLDVSILRSAERELFGQYGHAVSAGGDVDGDGFEDFIVGAPAVTDFPGGTAHVISGADLSSLYTLRGSLSFGASVSIPGDVNGDGLADMVVGAPSDSTGGVGAGSIFVFSGADGSVLVSVLGPSVGAGLGRSVSGIGDVNGDGRSDFMGGATSAKSLANGNNGRVYVYSGADGSVLHSHLGSSRDFGQSVSGVGDSNGDGKPDYIVGDPSGNLATLFSGADGSVLTTFRSDAPDDAFGTSVGDAGDVDGDGLDDIIVGAATARNARGSETGIAQVFSGADGSRLLYLQGETGGGRFGESVGSAGDFDGDGLGDVIVGSSRAGNNGLSSGSIYVFSGADGSVLYMAHGDSVNVAGLEAGFDQLGTSVDTGDFNGDGIPDIVAGAPWDDEVGTTSVFRSNQSRNLNWEQVTSESGTMIGGALPEMFLDVDSQALGFAVPEATGSGTWQLSLDDGRAFQDFGEVDFSRSLLLRETDRIRYIPGANDGLVASLGIVGWDQTTGVAGDKVDTSVRGGATAFSISRVMAHLRIATENQTPTAAHVDQTHTYVEGTDLVALTDIVVTDTDAAEQITVTLSLDDHQAGVLTTNSGHGERYNGDTGVWTLTGSIGQLNQALAQVAFRPVENQDQDTTIAVRIADDRGEHARALTGSIVLHVTPVNDAPVMRLFDVRTFQGISPGDQFGQTVSGAGDVNGDGLDDMIVGAKCHEQGGICAGSAFVFSGRDGRLLYSFDDEPAGRFFATNVDSAGDVNADGIPDLMVGSRYLRNVDRERVVVYSGADGSALYWLGARAGNGVGDVNGDGHDDIFVSGQLVSGADGLSVWSSLDPGADVTAVDGVGDLNADGFDDVIVGFKSSLGQVEVLAGSALPAGDRADPAVLYTFQANTPGDQLGSAVSGVGDVDGDGVPDFAAAADQLGNNGHGYVGVYSGVDGDLIHILAGDASLPGFGQSLSGAGDMNGDGLADIIVGGASFGDGWARVYSGEDGSVLYALTGRSANGAFGASVSGVGDANGDGLGDVLIGSPRDGAGRATLFMPTGPWEITPNRIDQPAKGQPIAALFPDLLTDVDRGALSGIAVRSTTGEGTWQFSTDGGRTFEAFGQVRPSRSLLLRSTDRIRYVVYVVGEPPVHGPTASFEFVGWDQSSGIAGAKADSSVTGGTTAFSVDAATAVMQIDPRQLQNPNLLAGDTNRDFQFDQRDVIQMLLSLKYLSGEEASWAEGDFNGDRVFDQLDILAALREDTFLQGPYAGYAMTGANESLADERWAAENRFGGEAAAKLNEAVDRFHPRAVDQLLRWPLE